MHCELLSDTIDFLGIDHSHKHCALHSMRAVIYIALIVLGSLGAAGVFPGGPTLGWACVGLGASCYVLTPAWSKFNENKTILFLEGMIAATFVAIGILGGIGHLTTSQVGWGMVGTFLAAFSIRAVSNLTHFRARINQQSALQTNVD